MTSRIGQVAYRLALPDQLRVHPVFHVSLLKAAHDNGVYQPPSAVELEEGEEEFEVHEILDHKPKNSRTKRKMHFLVSWKGFGPEQNTWEPFQNLSRCPEKLSAYWDGVRLHSPAAIQPDEQVVAAAQSDALPVRTSRLRMRKKVVIQGMALMIVAQPDTGTPVL